MTNELTKGSIIYSYDRFSNLVSAKGTDMMSVFRTFDDVGNVYGTEDRSDRIYGAGSRLETSGIDLKEKRNAFQGGYGKLVTKSVEYCYDEEGNLARKVEADGSVWEYSYYGNGLLRNVVRLDKSAVIFKYDALGRRIEKCITKAGSEKDSTLAPKEPVMIGTTLTSGKSPIVESTWETIGGVRIRRPNTELKKPHMVQGDNPSIYAGDEAVASSSEQEPLVVEKVIRFLWDNNTILHEWEDNAISSKKPQQKIDYQADYVVKLSEKKIQEAKEKTAKGESAPESLVTWIFQDDFIPRAKITQDGCYSIMTDYLGTPVGAYNETGNLVWERELDINGKVMLVGKDSYGRTMQDVGEKTFIPFRFQGQYEDEEIGLYYNRFRYYDPQTGQYTQQDPIGLAGGNPTLYGYVYDTLGEMDPFGLKINITNCTDEQLIDRIWELAYRDKRLYDNGGTHGVVHRIREQITGKMRYPSAGWFSHEEHIVKELESLRKALDEARKRGLSDVVNDKYPNVNKVATMKPPKDTDVKVPKKCM